MIERIWKEEEKPKADFFKIKKMQILDFYSISNLVFVWFRCSKNCEKILKELYKLFPQNLLICWC